ncbi:MAG: hypothetical protein ACK440_10050 [Sphingomonadaceae bacterium]|jgi:cytochrome P450
MKIRHLDIDPFDEAFLAAPYANQDALRDAGQVVWLEPVRCFSMARFAEVSASLNDWETFVASRRVGMTDFFKEETRHPVVVLLKTNPPVHDRTRGQVNKVTSLASIKQEMSGWCTKAEAERLVRSFLTTGIDIAVSGIANTIRTFVLHPYQRAKVRANLGLAIKPLEERLR